MDVSNFLIFRSGLFTVWVPAWKGRGPLVLGGGLFGVKWPFGLLPDLEVNPRTPHAAGPHPLAVGEALSGGRAYSQTLMTLDGSVPADGDEALVGNGAAPERCVVKHRDLGLHSMAQNKAAHLGCVHTCPRPLHSLHKEKTSVRREQVKPSVQCRIRVGHSPKDVTSDDHIERSRWPRRNARIPHEDVRRVPHVANFSVALPTIAGEMSSPNTR